eukprot:TRINITY_DN3998_c0_g7_i1.p1 TRINITY_DN3998_c0_g7~~TRINITY_DN3998_c0_g7_i1.p1  ORF type:complete len:326 (+),score=95.78 TRINITY_DN3998_c0_g7_i1:45-980(+)
MMTPQHLDFTQCKQKELDCEARVWALKDALKVAEAELSAARAQLGTAEEGVVFSPVSSECTVKVFKHLAQCIRESAEWKQRPSRCTITAEEATRALLETFHPSQLTTTKVHKPNSKKVFKQFTSPSVSEALLQTLMCSPTLPKVTTVLQLPEDPTMSLHIDVDVKDLPVFLDCSGGIEKIDQTKTKKSFIGNSIVRTKQGQKVSLIDVHADDILTIIKGARPLLKETSFGPKWEYKWKSITLLVKPVQGTPTDHDDGSGSSDWLGSNENSPSSSTVGGDHDAAFSRWEAAFLSPQSGNFSNPMTPPPLLGF